MFLTLTQVAVGGAIGSVLRYLMVAAVSAPLATLVVNVAGSLAMWVLFVTLASRTTYSPLPSLCHSCGNREAHSNPMVGKTI